MSDVAATRDAEELSLEDEAEIFLEGFRYGGRCIFCGHDPYEYVDVSLGGRGVPVAVTCCDHGIGLYQHSDEGLVRASGTIHEARWLIERLLAKLPKSKPKVSPEERAANLAKLPKWSSDSYDDDGTPNPDRNF